MNLHGNLFKFHMHLLCLLGVLGQCPLQLLLLSAHFLWLLSACRVWVKCVSGAAVGAGGSAEHSWVPGVFLWSAFWSQSSTRCHCCCSLTKPAGPSSSRNFGWSLLTSPFMWLPFVMEKWMRLPLSLKINPGANPELWPCHSVWELCSYLLGGC